MDKKKECKLIGAGAAALALGELTGVCIMKGVKLLKNKLPKKDVPEESVIEEPAVNKKNTKK